MDRVFVGGAKSEITITLLLLLLLLREDQYQFMMKKNNLGAMLASGTLQYCTVQY
jgi:hypothetical protein